MPPEDFVDVDAENDPYVESHSIPEDANGFPELNLGFVPTSDFGTDFALQAQGNHRQ
jgi:hypothetical protein